MAVNMGERFKTASDDFDRALQLAQTAFNASAGSPAMSNLVLALGRFSRATIDMLLVVSEQLDEVNHNVNNVAARLDGKKGPFNLRMR
jgi:hypothetical protein